MNKSILMIHEIYPAMFDLPLEDYILTFDDGLYSQFIYAEHFREIKTEKIYFVSSGIVAQGVQDPTPISCVDAHNKAFRGDTSNYMTVEQIRYLMEDPLTTIGGHSHHHTRLVDMALHDMVHHIKKDTELMLTWFESNLNFRPTTFCFPYNEDPHGLYRGILEREGFTEFHGHERTPIEMLLPDALPPVYRDA
jgi:hypothetical protein